MPELITETLLVTAPFKHDGVDYFRGDRVPVRHRAIRRIAAESPHLFAMEYVPEDLDLQWLAALELEAEARYRTAKQAREEQMERQKRALRHELETQDLPPAGAGEALQKAAGGGEAQAAGTGGARARGDREADLHRRERLSKRVQSLGKERFRWQPRQEKRCGQERLWL
jgi:hypothetical protein